MKICKILIYKIFYLCKDQRDFTLKRGEGGGNVCWSEVLDDKTVDSIQGLTRVGKKRNQSK